MKQTTHTWQNRKRMHDIILTSPWQTQDEILTPYTCILFLSSADPSITPQPDTIPVIYVTLGNDSLKAVTKALTWEDAKKNCEGEKANLVSIRNQWSLAYVELMAMNLKAPVWIGLNKKMVRDCGTIQALTQCIIRKDVRLNTEISILPI